MTSTPTAQNVPLLPATFAGGCFWGTQHHFKKKFGNALGCTTVGYMGGCAGGSTVKDAAEVLHLQYNPELTSYEELVLFFFQIHNSSAGGKKAKAQYRSAIFYHSEEQRHVAKEIIGKLASKEGNLGVKYREAFGDCAECVTALEPAGTFQCGEDRHQNFFQKNPQLCCSQHTRIYWTLND